MASKLTLNELRSDQREQCDVRAIDDRALERATALDDVVLPDFLVLGQESWGPVQRRNQQLIRALALRHPETRFLFVERALRPREAKQWPKAGLVRISSNIWRLQTIRPIPDAYGQKLSDRIETAQIRRGSRLVGLDRPYIWTQDPHAADLITRLRTSKVIYDLTDDWVAFEADRKSRMRVQRQVDYLLAGADFVFACSPSLQEMSARRGYSARYLPNAVAAPDPTVEPPTALLSLASPRLGYVGTLHSRRLDVEMLVAAASQRPTWSFVLVGPDQLEPRDRGLLKRLPNIHLFGTRPHAEIPSYLAGLDVGLILHRNNDFTRSLDPLKAYEYLAAGLPMIATEGAVSPKVKPFAEVCSNVSEFLAATEKLLKTDSSESRAERRLQIRDETWVSRARAIEAAVASRMVRSTASTVSVVVVSFNTRELLRQCIAAVVAQTGPDVEVIVMDNGSTDGSLEMLATEYPEVSVEALPGNFGFAAANNLALPKCTGEYILLLNSDAFLHAGSLLALVRCLERNPRAAACGPRLLNPDGSLQRSAWPFPTARRSLLESLGLHRVLRRTPFYEDLGTWAHDEEREVEFLVGACLLLRSCVLQNLRGFDPAFWMYGEEADLQRRMRNRGWSTIFCPEALVTHLGGASASTEIARLQRFYAGQFRFVSKHGGAVPSLFARAALLIGSCLRGRWRSFRIAFTPLNRDVTGAQSSGSTTTSRERFG